VSVDTEFAAKHNSNRGHRPPCHALASTVRVVLTRCQLALSLIGPVILLISQTCVLAQASLACNSFAIGWLVRTKLASTRSG
jgi:hypothetical protein